MENLFQFENRLFQGSGVDSGAEYSDELSSRVTKRLYEEIEITPHALQHNGDFGVRFDSGTKDFLFNAGQARAIISAEDFGIGAAQIVLSGQAQGCRIDPGVAQL